MTHPKQTSGDWRIETADGAEHPVRDADTIDGIDRFGVGVLVEWARDTGIASEDNPVRAIVSPDGQRITQF